MMKLRVKMNKMFNIFCGKSHKGGSNDDKCSARETNKMLSCYKKNDIKRVFALSQQHPRVQPSENLEAFSTDTTTADLIDCCQQLNVGLNRCTHMNTVDSELKVNYFWRSRFCWLNSRLQEMFFGFVSKGWKPPEWPLPRADSVFGSVVTLSKVSHRLSAADFSSEVQYLHLILSLFGEKGGTFPVDSISRHSVCFSALVLSMSSVSSGIVWSADLCLSGTVVSPYSWANLCSVASWRVSLKCRQEILTLSREDEASLWKSRDKNTELYIRNMHIQWFPLIKFLVTLY